MVRSVVGGAGLLALVVAILGAAPPPGGGEGQNPLLAKWEGPYGGFPLFSAFKVEHFKPALEAGMAEQAKEIDAIAANPAPPTFENTLGALERSGRTLARVSSIYGIYSSTMSSADFQVVERDMAPRLAAFQDQIHQNEKLFARILAVYEGREKAGLTPEQQRLSWYYYTDFVRFGAKLDQAAKKRLSEINQRLATLYTNFSQNVLADEHDYVTYLKSKDDLLGLPDSLVSAAASAAEGREHKGEWAITNTRSSMEPFLTYSARRDLRETVWRTYYSRGDHDDAKDTKKPEAK